MKEKRSVKPIIFLIGILFLAIFVAAIIIKHNWRRFAADASFGFTMAIIVIAVLLVLFLMIRHSIRKAKKEHAEKKAEKELQKEAQDSDSE